MLLSHASNYLPLLNCINISTMYIKSEKYSKTSQSITERLCKSANAARAIMKIQLHNTQIVTTINQ